MLVMIDGPMINQFIDDVDCFRKCADDRFHELDGDGDGFLSRNDLRRRLSPSIAFEDALTSPEMDEEKEDDIAESSDLIFSRFDADGNGFIDREEFRPMLMEIFIAMARGIGSTPVNVGVEEDSLLVRVYEHDLARNEKELEEIAAGKRKRKGSDWKDTLRRKSKKTLNMCGFGGICFGGNVL